MEAIAATHPPSASAGEVLTIRNRCLGKPNAGAGTRQREASALEFSRRFEHQFSSRPNAGVHQ